MSAVLAQRLRWWVPLVVGPARRGDMLHLGGLAWLVGLVVLDRLRMPALCRRGLPLLCCGWACAVAAVGCTAEQRAHGERQLAPVRAATVLAAPPGSAQNPVEGARPCSK